MTTTRTTCPYCGVGCGVLATRKPDGGIAIAGDPEHPANFGKLCSKGLALGETLDQQQRVLSPQVNGASVEWNEATQLVAQKFNEAIEQHGPDSVAFYVSGQFLTEDYYVANKLMKGFIGSANIDTNSRLCMASAVAGHNRAFGADIVPCNYSDLEEADLVVLTGSNFAWCHPVLFQRLQAAREKRGTKLVVIDPRRTTTAETADLHLAIAPQSDVALFNGLLNYLNAQGKADSKFVEANTVGLSDALHVASPWSIANVAAACGLNVKDVETFYQLFANTPKSVTVFSMGVNQSASGTDKVNAIINCHLLTGRIGKASAGPFSITGQPNAMGGREVGGLANMLAAHMEIENADHRNAVQKFWAAPNIADKAGLKAVELFQAMHDGKIKALWIMATNPAVSMPNSNFIVEALEACPFVVVSDVTANTETAKLAHVLLPAQGWGEKDGTVTNSERRISRQRRFVEPAGQARADWRIMADVAKAMGFAGFDYQSPADIFAEHARLTTIANEGTRKLDLQEWLDTDYETLEPLQWGTTQPFADAKFQTPDGKARFVATQFAALENSGFTLNTGRIRDQWHTMTRTGLVPKLFSHRGEPYLEINPLDAKRLNLGHAELAVIAGENGTSICRVLIVDAVSQGQVFQPMHWNESFASQGKANAASASVVDPVSGQPALKSSQVEVQRLAATWYGFGVSAAPIHLNTQYWAQRPIENGFSFECADQKQPGDWQKFIAEISANKNLSFVQSSEVSQFRCAAFENDRLKFAFFASAKPVNVSRSWLIEMLGSNASSFEILAGRPAAGQIDKGAIVCVCNGIGANQISNFVQANKSANLNLVCQSTNAGMGCGSCRPEVQKIMFQRQNLLQAAE